VLTSHDTFALVEGNLIEGNWTSGILIKEPSLPDLRRNEIRMNFYQIQMDKHAKKKWD